MGCVAFIAKYLSFCVHFLFTFISIFSIALGVVTLFLLSAYSEDQIILIVPVVVIVFGCVLFLITTCGCCGTIAGKSCPLITYSVFMVVLLAGSIYLCTIPQNEVPAVKSAVEKTLESIFEDDERRMVFYLLEGFFKCCGTTGPEAYLNRNLSLPFTCCANPSLNDTAESLIPESIGHPPLDGIPDNINEVNFCTKEDSYNGCTSIFVNFVPTIAAVLYFSLVAIIVVQAIGILIGFYLSYEFREKQKNVEEIVYTNNTNEYYYR